jgi:serine/threonine protein kinase
MPIPTQRIFKFKFLSRGATGWVFQIDDGIALKYARDERSDAFQTEINTYDMFDKHEPSPYILQSILRHPNLNFLPFMRGGSLEARIRANQRRDKLGALTVQHKEPLQMVERWAMELTGAVAWLETLGLVHGDLRPPNILLDDRDHLKLADFDCVDKIGSVSKGNAPPWARLRGDEAGPLKGTWGENGAQTEQFAIGSILYTLTRGFQPYEDQDCGHAIVQHLQDRNFPDLANSHLDGIIHRCWFGAYDTVGALAGETADLEGANWPRATVLDDQTMDEARQKCRQLLSDKHLFDTPER